jgi:hypothetical protein
MLTLATTILICSGLTQNFHIDLILDSSSRAVHATITDLDGKHGSFKRDYPNMHRQGPCLALGDIKFCKYPFGDSASLELSLLDKPNGARQTGWLQCSSPAGE